MADYVNATTGNLGFKGRDYGPGEKMTINETDRKNDPTADWWIRSGFVKPHTAQANESEGRVIHSMSYIPTYGGDTEGSAGESTKPVITETKAATETKK